MFDFVVKMHEDWRNFKILSNTNIKRVIMVLRESHGYVRNIFYKASITHHDFLKEIG